ncbi:MAG: hypothetical protein ACK42C_00220 [Aquificaceae bacterium]
MQHLTFQTYKTLLAGQQVKALGLFPYAGITWIENTLPEEEPARWFMGYLLGRALLKEGHRLVYVDYRPLSAGLLLSLASFFEEYLPKEGEDGNVYYYSKFSEKIELLRHVRVGRRNIFLFDGGLPEEDLRSFILEGHGIVFLSYDGDNPPMPPDMLYTLSLGQKGYELCLRNGRKTLSIAEIEFLEGEPIINLVEVGDG